MRIRKVSRYYCDFCKKANCSRPSIERHERGCTLNPNRRCGMCDMVDSVQLPIAELIALLPDPAPIQLPMVDDDAYWDAQRNFADALIRALPALREATANCPACIMAALRQAKIPVPMAEGFDFTAESTAILNDVRRDRSEEFRRLIGPVY